MESLSFDQMAVHPMSLFRIPIMIALAGLLAVGPWTRPAFASATNTESLQQMGTTVDGVKAKVKVGQPLPSWAGFSPQGVMVRWADILKPRTGQAPSAVVISFFGTWCLPCRHGLRVIQNVMDDTDGAAAVLIALPPQLYRVQPFLKGLGVRQNVINDTHKKIAGRFGVAGAVPRTVVVDGRGIVRAIYGEEGADFEQVLRQALADAASRTASAARQ